MVFDKLEGCVDYNETGGVDMNGRYDGNKKQQILRLY